MIKLLDYFIYNTSSIHNLTTKIEDIQKDNKRLQKECNKNAKAISQLKKENLRMKRELNKVSDYNFYRSLEPNQYPRYLKEWYYKRTGKKLNLEHPRNFNEKIQWIKLYDCTDKKTRLTDKYLVREYITEQIGEKYLIPLIGVYDSFEQIDFEKLPNQFVMKANHGCKWNIIVKDKATFNIVEAEKKFRNWLSWDFAFREGFELQYSKIEPKIIIENYIESREGGLDDYKIYCFDGVPKYIQYITGREDGKKKMAFFDLNWNRMPFISNGLRVENSVPMPKKLDEMVNSARTLSNGFKLVRVDFYSLPNGEIKFGEMTFTPASGLCKWDPIEYNEIIGNMIQIP